MPTLTVEQVKTSLIPQRDDFSCGPACLATVAKLCGSKHDYHFFRGLLSPRPNYGSHPYAMRDAAQEYLPFDKMGEGAYSGGLAIAYIIHPDDDVDHYVVYLGREGSNIIYYDPFDHDVFFKPAQQIKSRATRDWSGVDHRIDEWALTFRPSVELCPKACRSLVATLPRGIVKQFRDQPHA